LLDLRKKEKERRGRNRKKRELGKRGEKEKRREETIKLPIILKWRY